MVSGGRRAVHHWKGHLGLGLLLCELGMQLEPALGDHGGQTPLTWLCSSCSLLPFPFPVPVHVTLLDVTFLAHFLSLPGWPHFYQEPTPSPGAFDATRRLSLASRPPCWSWGAPGLVPAVPAAGTWFCPARRQPPSPPPDLCAEAAPPRVSSDPGPALSPRHTRAPRRRPRSRGPTATAQPHMPKGRHHCD